MKAEIAQRLIQLNKEFYQRHARSFSATRGRLQPGVQRILEAIPPEASVLDLGCGNGGVAAELQRRGFRGHYVGMDFSAELLRDTIESVQRPKSEVQRQYSFIQASLTEFSHKLSAVSAQQFDHVLCFASLHHIPTEEMRLGVLRQVADWLEPDGHFTLSVWQFLNSERLRERIQPWARAGLSDAEVDPGDYLLDWRSEGEGLRYVHAFSEAELGSLAERSGFTVADSFYSDGHGGRLGLYQTWRFNNHHDRHTGGVST